MTLLNFTLAQIEAFACVCESGTLTQAARKLKKDRTTISELVDYLELDLGYPLFDRSTRPLTLTDAGQLLYRQARLFLHEAQAFAQIARQIPQQMSAHITLCYDPFTPRDFLFRLTRLLQSQQIQLELIMCERGQAEQWLAEGIVDIGLFQAMNRSINDSLRWRVTGSISLAVYAGEGFFPAMPVSILQLASSTQLIPFQAMPAWLAQRLQIADRTIRVTEIAMLEKMLGAGDGWAFLPIHFQAENWRGVERIETELGDSGLSHPMVTLSKPGQIAQPLLSQLMDAMQEAWGD
ncbi:LysR family transcriptional regulator [Enterobacteriaceae bacterium H11S18]|uniref:LysR family transcriptional regulator n=1 Tax=Dryocola clanedunensis TaxID=2925396 RepID=UPI0022F022A4|nr:LysR family transcriptional regulator [Dryocola clanedunensis]MCT4713122.1 LysR family transcriptional regulator [Dryocola clanedunensis]